MGNNCDGQVDEGFCPNVTNLSARAKLTKVSLLWTHVGADSYNVYRKTNGGVYELIANTTSTYSTYLDAGVTIGTTYYYMVKSVCQGVEGGASNEVTITPAAR
ncbi:hypothetical protein PITCH_A870003 [uncultured Desulfobacterium sp.]|uniref:Fibronectin type-III domain-containing protein n=1 Tax=uncultured Desulfobacterium sp. TaxID=201089 RepID=A0A445N3G4_9BACT|nr:hypothetical protein PITCH_A860011 [uncultured Desulfobacterium sp.]SPD76248.1 hypothetical protein PITCH_A870003 [uncultured Desulfobacterium sp.]